MIHNAKIKTMWCAAGPIIHSRLSALPTDAFVYCSHCSRNEMGERAGNWIYLSASV